jgi:hypothetical protein
MTTATPPAPAGSSRARIGGPLSRLTTLLVMTVGLAATATATLDRRLRVARHDESGNVITDNLAWIVFGVIAIVAIGALIKTLGGTVIIWVQNQLNV